MEPAKPVRRNVDFAFLAGTTLRAVAEQSEVVIDGVAGSGGYIEQAQDVDSNTVDHELTPGGNVVIFSVKIKVEGDELTVRVFFSE